MQRRQRLLALYAVVCALALTFPGFEWLGNRLRPTIMGLPFSFAYNVAWVVMTFFVLLAFYRGEEGHRP